MTAVTRRSFVMASAAASVMTPVLAKTGQAPMPASTRAATPADIPAIVPLLIQNAQARHAIDPLLWRMDDQAATRTTEALTAAFATTGPQRDHIFVAEANGQLAGVTRAMLVPVPPIYDPGVQPALLQDDCFTAPNAPPGTAEALLAATETAMREAGADSFIASCTIGTPQHALYTGHDYEPVTLYLAKHGFTDAPFASDIRPATGDDIPAIVTLSAAHRKTLQKINDRFWHVHPEADARFGMWMQYSLTLKDRDMLVATTGSGLAGYAIAQPVTRLHIPAAHDIAKIGVLDDFYDTDFASIETASSTASATHLITATESAFARRGMDSALVVCPNDWTSKHTLLEQRGYKSAKVWMLKKTA
ncbi:MAG TPA: hypothetical protein VHL34_11300 [Rhizomicrobium sp.]|nr:hypothetical protein [Rhizomicrobium sp.]